MSGLLFPPSHCNAFSVRGRTATKSKCLVAEMMFAFSVAGSSIVTVMRDRKRICGKSGKGFDGIGFVYSERCIAVIGDTMRGGSLPVCMTLNAMTEYPTTF